MNAVNRPEPRLAIPETGDRYPGHSEVRKFCEANFVCLNPARKGHETSFADHFSQTIILATHKIRGHTGKVWGMGHSQQMFLDKPHWRFRHTHGGTLRQKRRGRKARPISNKTPIHLVFKADRTNLKRGFRSPLGFIIVTDTLKKYSKKFFVKVEQAAVCQDHIHLIVRFSKRSKGLDFLRVFAGQTAQQFRNREMVVTDTQKLWKHRPFSRVVIGRKAFSVLRAYVRLNHLESIKKIAYRKERLRGMLAHEYGLLWS